jgi:hypothetical protein
MAHEDLLGSGEAVGTTAMAFRRRSTGQFMADLASAKGRMIATSAEC